MGLQSRVSRWIFLAAALALSAPVALAYIPPAQFIIRNMATKRSGVRSVRVLSVAISGSQHFKVTTIYDGVRRTMRSEAFDESGIPLYVMQKKAEALPLSLLVLYDPSYSDLVGALQRVNIPVSSAAPSPRPSPLPSAQTLDGPDGDDVISLQRWNGSIAWALGLLPQKSSASQLWIEKDSFLPVRLLVGDQDVQFANYRYSQALPYPRTTTLATRQGAVVLEEDIQSFQINPSPAAVRALKVSDAPAATGLTSAGASSPLKSLIQAYYAGLR